jgi:hypothetical protein
LIFPHHEAEVAQQRDALSALYLALKDCALFHAVFADLPGLVDDY